MTSESDFEQFAENFRREVIDASQDPESEAFMEEQFTETFLEYLTDIAVVEDYNLCRLEGKGFKINGYNSNVNAQTNGENEGIFFDLFVTIYTNGYSKTTVAKSEIASYIKKVRTFFSNAIYNKYSKIEESNPAFDLSDTIYENRDNISGVNFFIITDGRTKLDPIPDEKEGEIRISHQVWDLDRLFRLSSDNRPEPIEIDFIRDFGEPLPCLEIPKENPQYVSYLAIMPGKMIAELYGKYGPKLLERNIRVFLQMKGKVNKGIRETIRNEPCMFFAYNNGISTTAEKVKIEKNSYGIPCISWIRDFQIVNGGQTTAAIHFTYFKERSNISDVLVQVKLTVLKKQDDMEIIVPKISQYANSQNTIKESDFASNQEFHIEIEKRSRTVWAPAKKGSQLDTRWFYERSRGQYQVDKDREPTAKQKKIFSVRNPTSQRFTKTDLAKYENSWDQLPHMVSLGSQKNFRAYVIKQKDGPLQIPDQFFFKLIVAKAILFKKTDGIIKKLDFGPYKGNYVTYTVALLSKLTNKRLDLEKIWKEQDLSPSLQKFIGQLASEVRNNITEGPSGSRNISEWCKKKECWESVQKIRVDIPASLNLELISDDAVKTRDEYFGKQGKPVIPDIDCLLEQELQRIPEIAEDTEPDDGSDIGPEKTPIRE